MPSGAQEPEIIRIMRSYQRALRRREQRAVREMLARWSEIWKRLQADALALQREVRALEQAGKPVSRWKILQMERYQALMVQVRREMEAFGRDGEAMVRQLQRDGLATGAEMAAVQIEAMGGVVNAFDRLPVSALEHMVGFLADGSPLAALFRELGETTSRRIGDVLLEALAKGWNPRKTARGLRKEAGLSLTRALRIARTEQLRAFRAAAIAGYRSSGVVRGYRRVAVKSERTCIACLLKDGDFYELKEEFTDHVNGRCAVVPVLPNMNVQWESGRDWFLRQPPDVQRKIVGNKMFEAWQKGQIGLDDMVYLHKSHRWGDSWQAASLKQALENAKKSALSGDGGSKGGQTNIPVSNAIRVGTKRGFLRNAVDTALSAIDSVHGDGELPEIPIKLSRSKWKRGSFWYVIGKPERIDISKVGGGDALTVVHEVGHFLDLSGLGRAGEFASLAERDTLMAEWWEAINATPEVQQLQNTNLYPYSYRAYLLKPIELWARSYSQYIAQKSGNAELLRDLEERLEEAPLTHWTEESFRSIMEAIDKLFVRLRWLK